MAYKLSSGALMRIGVVVVVLILLGLTLYVFTGSSMPKIEGMESKAVTGAAAAAAVKGSPGSAGGNLGAAAQGDLNPSELLPPTGLGTAWSQTNPVPADMKGQNFLSSGALVGVNTIGTSKKNATHDIRGDYPNPRAKVSPWLNTTIESADPYRRTLETVGTPA
jgi:hypothetical protein